MGGGKEGGKKGGGGGKGGKKGGYIVKGGYSRMVVEGGPGGDDDDDFPPLMMGKGMGKKGGGKGKGFPADDDDEEDWEGWEGGYEEGGVVEVITRRRPQAKPEPTPEQPPSDPPPRVVADDPVDRGPPAEQPKQVEVTDDLRGPFNPTPEEPPLELPTMNTTTTTNVAAEKTHSRDPPPSAVKTPTPQEIAVEPPPAAAPPPVLPPPPPPPPAAKPQPKPKAQPQPKPQPPPQQVKKKKKPQPQPPPPAAPRVPEETPVYEPPPPAVPPDVPRVLLRYEDEPMPFFAKDKGRQSRPGAGPRMVEHPGTRPEDLRPRGAAPHTQLWGNAGMPAASEASEHLELVLRRPDAPPTIPPTANAVIAAGGYPLATSAPAATRPLRHGTASDQSYGESVSVVSTPAMQVMPRPAPAPASVGEPVTAAPSTVHPLGSTAHTAPSSSRPPAGSVGNHISRFGFPSGTIPAAPQPSFGDLPGPGPVLPDVTRNHYSTAGQPLVIPAPPPPATPPEYALRPSASGGGSTAPSEGGSSLAVDNSNANRPPCHTSTYHVPPAVREDAGVVPPPAMPVQRYPSGPPKVLISSQLPPQHAAPAPNVVVVQGAHPPLPHTHCVCCCMTPTRCCCGHVDSARGTDSRQIEDLRVRLERAEAMLVARSASPPPAAAPPIVKRSVATSTPKAREGEIPQHKEYSATVVAAPAGVSTPPQPQPLKVREWSEPVYQPAEHDVLPPPPGNVLAYTPEVKRRVKDTVLQRQAVGDVAKVRTPPQTVQQRQAVVVPASGGGAAPWHCDWCGAAYCDGCGSPLRAHRHIPHVDDTPSQWVGYHRHTHAERHAALPTHEACKIEAHSRGLADIVPANHATPVPRDRLACREGPRTCGEVSPRGYVHPLLRHGGRRHAGSRSPTRDALPPPPAKVGGDAVWDPVYAHAIDAYRNPS